MSAGNSIKMISSVSSVVTVAILSKNVHTFRKIQELAEQSCQVKGSS